jgi:hypothetical protein
MDERDIDALAQYNTERSRGIVHTPECDREMAALQHHFDEQRIRDLEALGWTLQPNGSLIRMGKPRMPFWRQVLYFLRREYWWSPTEKR